ncbi:ParA family protein [Actinomadura flavalba]|uniref:ParA family protein n=1 Tax=Actinomadura flavalba TaxID=1120938 RepID=UPI0003713F8F|nr:ParA family protein [Actinomadura flavalba]
MTESHRPIVITLGMLKGGSGKTTSAMFIALRYARSGRRVVVLDADPTSQSAHDWARLAGDALPVTVVRHTYDDIADEIGRQAQAHDVVVVDVGGGAPHLLEAAASVSDVLLMPLAPAAADARRVAATLASAERGAARNRRGLLAYVVIVRADGRSAEPARWREQMQRDGHPLVETTIGARVLYSRAYGTAPSDVGEYEALLAEVEQDLAVNA